MLCRKIVISNYDNNNNNMYFLTLYAEDPIYIIKCLS